MKKTYFNPLGVKHAAKIISRRFPASSRFASSAYKTDAGGDEGTDVADPPPADPAKPKPDTRKAEELFTKIETRMKNLLKTRASKEELEEILKPMREELKDLPIEALREMADDKTGVMAKLAVQGLEIQKLQNRLANDKPKDMSLRGQVTAWVQENKDALEAIKNGERRETKPLEIRVASPMTPATVNSGNSPWIGRVEVEPGVNELIRARPVFWDYIVKGRTGAATYVWVNKANPLGAAAFIGPGVPKPGVSFELVAETSNAKKIADSAKAATELLQDIDGMVTFIEQELRYQVMIKVNQKLMNGVSSATDPNGIQTLSVPYTLTSVHTTNPTFIDAIRAVVAQMRSGWLQGDITVFINSIDAANMDLSKAVDSGVYLLPPFVTSDGRTIAGARIVEDNNVPVGYLQAAFLQYYRILIYKDFSVSWGWENDDFTKNLVTAVGEMRLHQFFNSIYTGAFVYDSFANVIAAVAVTP